MLNSSDIYNALNVASVTNLLSAYKTGKALFADLILPKDCTASSSVNFYFIAAPDSSQLFDEERFSASCRAKTYGQAIEIGRAVITAINRISRSGLSIYCTAGQVIPPADSTDNYNMPVEIRIKKR